LLTSECLAAASSVFENFFFKTQPSDAAVAAACAQCSTNRHFLEILDQVTSNVAAIFFKPQEIVSGKKRWLLKWIRAR
jgi:hypothetical protein